MSGRSEPREAALEGCFIELHVGRCSRMYADGRYAGILFASVHRQLGQLPTGLPGALERWARVLQVAVHPRGTVVGASRRWPKPMVPREGGPRLSGSRRHGPRSAGISAHPRTIASALLRSLPAKRPPLFVPPGALLRLLRFLLTPLLGCTRRRCRRSRPLILCP